MKDGILILEASDPHQGEEDIDEVERSKIIIINTDANNANFTTMVDE